MANALKTLFTDIAESIRGGLPDEGLMKPNVFPSKIDEIVALLENAGSGEGGTGSSGSVGNLKFASGSYNVGTNRNRATVTHGFNTMPDLIIVWYTGFYGGTKEEYIEEFPLELAWGMKSKFSSQTLSGYVIPGFGVSANSGINNYTDSIGIYCPDQYTFQFGSSANDGGGRLLTGARYNWLAISGMGGAIGGVDSDLVKYVTFIGADGTELYRMPVLDGDDCKDPYTRGDIEKPTKESTVSQVFTYNGWALTEGGSADANALKAVTEDRTVYAAFEESVREYTITYYDDDGTFLSSQTLAYGATPSYTPTKDNYKFLGWNPSVEVVTGDAIYTASWEEIVVLASGKTGTNVTWFLYPDYTLELIGTGATSTYSDPAYSPVKNYKNDIKHVIIGEGITSIGKYLLYEPASLQSITVPTTLTKWTYYSILLASQSKPTVYYNGSFEQWINIDFEDRSYNNPTCYGGFLYCNGELITEAIFPEGTTEIKPYVIDGCGSITSIIIPASVTKTGSGLHIKSLVSAYYLGTWEQWCGINFVSQTSTPSRGGKTGVGIDMYINGELLSGQVTFPNGMTNISYQVSGNRKVTSAIIPSSVTSITKQAFYNTGLSSATFEDTTGWTAGTTAISSSDLANTSTAATYLKTTHYNKDWSKS